MHFLILLTVDLDIDNHGSARGPSHLPGLAGVGRKARFPGGMEGRFTRGKVKAPGRRRRANGTPHQYPLRD